MRVNGASDEKRLRITSAGTDYTRSDKIIDLFSPQLRKLFLFIDTNF